MKVDVQREFEFDNNQDVIASPSISIDRVRYFEVKNHNSWFYMNVTDS